MSRKDTRAYLGAYGGVILPKAFCPLCQSYAFVNKGKLACCNAPSQDLPEKWKRESLASGIRQLPTKDYQHAQCARQQDRCFYCARGFGSTCIWKNRLQTLRIHWDHLVPFGFLQTNPLENFVAACHICNALKGSQMFQTVEEARSYVAIKRNPTPKTLPKLP